MRIVVAWIACVLAALGSHATPASAAFTREDLLIAARALSFLQNPPAGAIRVGIVYAEGVPRSLEQADTVVQMLADGLKVGNIILMPIKVRVEDLASASVQLLLLTEYVGNDAARVSGATAAKRIPYVTVDIAAVQNGRCVMGVRADPRIEILVNRAAAANSGTSFATVFRMLVTEI